VHIHIPNYQHNKKYRFFGNLYEDYYLLNDGFDFDLIHLISIKSEKYVNRILWGQYNFLKRKKERKQNKTKRNFYFFLVFFVVSFFFQKI